MKKRKPNDMRRRVERSMRALLSSNHVAVVNLDPSCHQGLINWRNCKNIPPGQQIADAICDIAHQWTIYLGALCIDQSGNRYIKAVEIAPQGIYLVKDLADAIEHSYLALRNDCNPNHLIGSGWIAIPSAVSLEEDQAARVFDAVGAWSQQRAA